MELERKAVSGIMLTAILIGILTFSFNVQPVKAVVDEPIYIRPDGSIEPSTAPIKREGDVYTLTDNIMGGGINFETVLRRIVVQRDSIVIDGAGHTVHGAPAIYPDLYNMVRGIDLSYRSNVTVKNTVVTSNSPGIWLEEAKNNTLFNNTITLNYHGIVVSGSGNVISGNTIGGNSRDVFVSGSNNVISENNITGWNLYSISLSGSCNIVYGNTITGFGAWGIIIDGSGNMVYSNTVTGRTAFPYSLFGIVLDYYSYDNTVSNNNIASYGWYGIWLKLSSNNKLFGNKIINNQKGIYLADSCGGNIISDNNITNNGNGIHLYMWSSSNTISDNNIAGNSHGIYLEHSSYAVLSGNNIMHNEVGIGLSTSYSKVFHNNFVNNTHQVYIYVYSGYPWGIWDDGYPSGGNYWSDYTGVDLFSGPYQNETGTDGVGDIPYFIDVSDIDRYPFIRKSGWKLPTPEQAIRDLINIVQQMNLQQGIANSLDAKLANILASLEALKAEQRNDTINKLYAFINEVEAQRGNKITDEQADYMIAKAREIIDLIE